MPTVPTYDNYQVMPSTDSGARFDSQPEQNYTGQQLDNAGKAMMQSGQQIGSIATDMQQHTNQIRVDDALNQAKEVALQLQHGPQGFLSLKGINALQRPDGKPIDDEYGDILKDHLSKTADSLGNNIQKEMFNQAAAGMLTNFRGQAVEHMMQKSNVYALSTSEGIQNTAMRDITLNYNNPDAINEAVNRIKAETYRQAQLQGYSAEWQEAQSRKITSQAHTLAIMTALENNQPQYAQAYLGRYKDQMEADDILKTQSHTTNEMNGVTAMNAVNNVIATNMHSLAPGNSSRLFNLVIGQESGGKQYEPNGQPLTSPKGAIGIAQVMPETAPEAAKLAGLPWDENRYKTDPEYNKALGYAYLNKQVHDFGDYQQAVAAYNAGPARTRDALEQAEADGKADQWVSYLPKETQGYVNAISSKYESGLGAPSKPTILDIDAQLQKDPTIANNPQAMKLAHEHAQQRLNDINTAVKQRNDEAVVTAMRNLEANGGDYLGLDPGVRNAVPPDQVDKVKGYGKSIANGYDYTDLALYQKLSTEPKYLKSLSDAEFYKLRASLSVNDFKHFSDERNKLMNPGSISGNDPSDLDGGAIKTALDHRLKQLNISTTQISGTDSIRVGGLRAYVDQYLLTEQRNAGHKFKDAEINAALDNLFAKSATIKGFWGDSKKQLMAMTASDIDSDTIKSYKSVFDKNGISNPTDQQLLNMYWNDKVRAQ